MTNPEPLHSFISEKLIFADLQMMPILEKNRIRLDNITKDVKLLEQKLKTHAIPTNFHFVYQKKPKASIWLRKHHVSYGDDTKIGYLEIKSFCLSWEKDSHENSRILHYDFSSLFEIFSKVYNPYGPNDFWIKEVNYCEYKYDNTIKNLKPLAECSTSVRIQVFPYLDEFYLKIQNFLESPILSETFLTESETIKTQPSFKEIILQEAIEMNCAISEEEMPF